MNDLKRKIFFTLGFVFAALGIIGAVLPILPSTVFFILAAWAFARSSEKFYYRIINDPVVGKHVRNYLERRGMPLRAKFISIFALFTTISISLYFIPRKPVLVALLLSVAFGVAGYIISLNTLNSVEAEEQ